MRRILFVLTLLAALIPTAGQSASAQVVALAQFSGYSTGTAVHAGALQSGTTRLVDSELAFSGANVNSAGLGAPLTNEMAQGFQDAAPAGAKSAARGSGLEIGLDTQQANLTGANQINPGSTVQAFAPASTVLLTQRVRPGEPSHPLVNARLLRGQAQAIYSNSVCVLGQPISSGLGYAANANLVNSSRTASLLATNTVANAVNQSKSFTYLTPNGDGTYGLVTETHQILAPVTSPRRRRAPLGPERRVRRRVGSPLDGHRQAGRRQGGLRPGRRSQPTTVVLTIKAAGLLVADVHHPAVPDAEGPRHHPPRRR